MPLAMPNMVKAIHLNKQETNTEERAFMQTAQTTSCRIPPFLFANSLPTRALTSPLIKVGLGKNAPTNG